ncbi:protein kinase domain-containing protein [Streptacidiphilus monticola]|uniref:non-specific serine/threonine protein kinase n=1 Tax=Streptacidiphilus monticola TaxID=2161674 RepID=A0ABW1G388_9ACTN
MENNGGTSFELAGSGAEPLEPGDPRRIGDIPLVGRLGSGGMGRVYLGVAGERYAAVKQVLPHFAEDENFLRHFGHELDNLSRLPAEVSAELLASDRDARPPWFATAYIPGLTLSDALALHGGPFTAPELWLLLREAAAGLRAVHALDMVHRDLKPSNVMLTREGVTLIDFGVARAADQSRLTRTGMMVGTPAYMSPEQATASKGLTGATDVFALGSLIAYAATGTPPFGEGSGVDLLYRIVHAEPDLEALRAVDRDLAETVAACLDKNPHGRPTAARLVRLAASKGTLDAPGWPAAVMDRLAERAAFADRAVPELPAEPEPEPGSAAGPGPVPASERSTAVVRPTERRGRNRLVLAVVPLVVVTGATLAVTVLPTLTAPQAETPKGGASAPVTGVAGAGPTASGSATASGAVSSSAGPSGSASAGTSSVPPGATPAPGGAGGGQGAGSGNSGGSGSAGGLAGSGGGNGGGSTTTRSTAPAGGGSTTTRAASPTTVRTTAPASAGSFALKNASNGECLAVDAFNNGLTWDSCSASASQWFTRSAAGGGYQVVSKKTDSLCLQAGMFNNNSTVGSCGSSGLQSWYSGSNGSMADHYDGNCLDLAFGGGVTTASCSGSASQHWSRV